jgi:hypothetical protein
MLRSSWGSSALQSASALRERDGALALVVARPVPLLAEATVVVAGLTSMRRSTFAGACGLGNLVVAALFAGLRAARSDGSMCPTPRTNASRASTDAPRGRRAIKHGTEVETYFIDESIDG